VRAQVFVEVIVIGSEVGPEVLVFPYGVPQFVLADRFQQIIDAAVFECLRQVFIISCGKNYGTSDGTNFEDIEGKSV
jgi:hypothetical protein